MPLYKQILEYDANSIEAINSIAYCVKYAAVQSKKGITETDLQELCQIYDRSLKID